MDRKLRGLTLLALALAAGCGRSAPESESVVDDPSTTNDESNDQALGSRGVTMCVGTPHNSRDYTLDVSIDDSGVVEEIYFPKGGNVDFSDCRLDADNKGECEDEEGRLWEFSGEC